MKNTFLLEGSLYWRPGMQLSITREREYFSLPLHTHDFIEIQYVAEGRGQHYIGEQSLIVEQKDVFVIPIGTPHVYRPLSAEAKDELIVYNCLVGLEMLERLQKAVPLPQELEQLLGPPVHGHSSSYAYNRNAAVPERYHRFKDHAGEVRRIMEGLHREHMLRQPGCEAYMSGYLIQLLLTLHRLHTSEGAAASAYSEIGVIFDYIDRHYAEPLTLKELADLIPISVSHLQRLFKTAAGQPFTEYLQNLRIEKSCDLLLQTRLSVSETAARVGYKDTKFFHALFKKKTGLSPHQYRKRELSRAAISRISREGNGTENSRAPLYPAERSGNM